MTAPFCALPRGPLGPSTASTAALPFSTCRMSCDKAVAPPFTPVATAAANRYEIAGFEQRNQDVAVSRAGHQRAHARFRQCDRGDLMGVQDGVDVLSLAVVCDLIATIIDHVQTHRLTDDTLKKQYVKTAPILAEKVVLRATFVFLVRSGHACSQSEVDCKDC